MTPATAFHHYVETLATAKVGQFRGVMAQTASQKRFQRVQWKWKLWKRDGRGAQI
jgi:hypothetical protein